MFWFEHFERNKTYTNMNFHLKKTHMHFHLSYFLCCRPCLWLIPSFLNGNWKPESLALGELVPSTSGWTNYESKKAKYISIDHSVLSVLSVLSVFAAWCSLVFCFRFEEQLLHCMGFGTSHAVLWLQRRSAAKELRKEQIKFIEGEKLDITILYNQQMKQTRCWNESKAKHKYSRYELKVTLDRSKKSLGTTFLEQHGISVLLVPRLPAQVCWSTFRRAAAFSTRTFMSQRTSHHDRSWPFMAIHDPHFMKFLKLFLCFDIMWAVFWLQFGEFGALEKLHSTNSWMGPHCSPAISFQCEYWKGSLTHDIHWGRMNYGIFLKIFLRATLNPCLNTFCYVLLTYRGGFHVFPKLGICCLGVQTGDLFDPLRFARLCTHCAISGVQRRGWYYFEHTSMGKCSSFDPRLQFEIPCHLVRSTHKEVLLRWPIGPWLFRGRFIWRIM